jgi:integration host factor subunit beta
LPTLSRKWSPTHSPDSGVDELVQRIAGRNAHLYQRDVENIFSAILDEIAAGFARGDQVELRGIGVFSVRHRKARTGRNPRTGVHVQLDQRRFPFFKASKEMVWRLNPEPRSETIPPPSVAV